MFETRYSISDRSIKKLKTPKRPLPPRLVCTSVVVNWDSSQIALILSLFTAVMIFAIDFSRVFS